MSRNWLIDEKPDLAPKYECTACQTTIIEKADTKLHQKLGCIICKQCHRNYAITLRETKNGEGFSLNRLRHEGRCRLCCEDKYLIACTSKLDKRTCRHAFCQGCVQRFDSEADILNDYRLSPNERAGHKWACFLCDQRKLVRLRREAAKFTSNLEAYEREHQDPNLRKSTQMGEQNGELDPDSSSTEISDEEFPEETDSESTVDLEDGEPAITERIPEQNPSPQDELIVKKNKSNQSSRTARCSYRASNWSIIGHYVKDTKLDFKVKWDGFHDFDTLEPVEFVMTDYQGLRAYLKKVKEEDCYTFDAVIKIAPELADVFRSTAPKVIPECPKASASHDKIKKPKNIRSQDSLHLPDEEVLCLNSKATKRKSPTKSRSSPHIDHQSPTKRTVGDKLPRTSVIHESEGRNNIPVNELRGNPKQLPDERPTEWQAQNKPTIESDSLTLESSSRPPNNLVSAPKTKSHSDKSRRASEIAKSNADHTIDQPPAPSDLSPVLKSPSDKNTQALTIAKSIVEIAALPPTIQGPSQNNLQTPTVKIPSISKQQTYDGNSTRISVIVTAKQSTTDAAANKLPNINELESVEPSTNVLPQARDTTSIGLQQASVTSSLRVEPESTVRQISRQPNEETQPIAKTKHIAGPPKSSANIEMRSKIDNLNQTNQSIDQCKTSAPKTKIVVNILSQNKPETRVRPDISPPLDRDAQAQKRDGAELRARGHPSSDSSSELENNKKGSTISEPARQAEPKSTSADKHSPGQGDQDYRIPKFKRNQTSLSSHPSKDQLNILPAKTSLCREDLTAGNKTKESTPNELTKRYTGNIRAINKQTLNSFVASRSGLRPEDKSSKPCVSRPADTAIGGARRKHIDRDTLIPIGPGSRGDRRSSLHSISRASSRDSYHSSKVAQTSGQTLGSLSPESRIKGHIAEIPKIIRRYSDDRAASAKRIHDNQHSQAPRAARIDFEPSSSRGHIFNRLSDRHEEFVGIKTGTHVEHDPNLRVRKMHGTKPNPYRWSSAYIYPSSHHPALVPHVVETLLRRLGDYKGEDENGQRNSGGKRYQLVVRKPYTIRGSLKYIGLEEWHNNGIEAIVQCSSHKLHYEIERHKTYLLPVFEVKFWGHEETVKLSMSDVVKADFKVVKKFVQLVAKKDPNRYGRWKMTNHPCYRIHCSHSPRQCLSAIERKERYAYEAYLKARDLSNHGPVYNGGSR